MLSLAEPGWAVRAVATASGVLMVAVGVGRGVGLAIPGKATVGETEGSVPLGCPVGAAVVPQATAATATIAVIQACQCPFSLTKSSSLAEISHFKLISLDIRPFRTSGTIKQRPERVNCVMSDFALRMEGL